MVYFTGDFHGDARELRYRFSKVELKDGDTVVVLGDAGLNYYGTDRDRKGKKFLTREDGTEFLCIHGNHEMRPATISSYHEEEWHGGIVYTEDDYPNIKFAKDGEIYDLDGNKCIAIGGAYSVDKYYRLLKGFKWFSDEQPDDVIKKRVEDRLESANWNIDYVLSHTCPSKYIPTEMFIGGIDQSTVDNSTEEWLDEIESKLTYKKWLCGHWHTDKQIDNMQFLFKGIAIPEVWNTWRTDNENGL